MAKKRFYLTLREVWERSVVVLAESDAEAIEKASDGVWDEETEFSQDSTADITLEDEDDEEETGGDSVG